MDELILGGKKYISSKRASEITGYAKDYIGQLARGGKIPATRVGRAWYVDEAALILHEGTGVDVVGDAPVASDEEVQSQSESASPYGHDEASPIPINRPQVSEKKIPTVSHAFLRPLRELPGTWTAVNYFSDDHTLLPLENMSALGSTSTFAEMAQNKEISASQEKNNLRIRILQAKTGTNEVSVVSTPLKEVVQEKKSKQNEQRLPNRKSHARVASHYSPLSYGLFVFSSTAFALLVLSSGFFVGSHVTITPGSDLYTANAYLSYEYVEETVKNIPALQMGFGTLKDFSTFIAGSSHDLFLEGFSFLKWLVHLG